MLRALRAVGILLAVLCAVVYWRGVWGYLPPRRVWVPTLPEEQAKVVAQDPQQRGLWLHRQWKKSGYVLTAVAEFALTGRVLLQEQFSNDRESDLAPVDLTLGWGPMAEPTFVAKVSLRHSGRFYFWQCADGTLSDTISTHSANMHMIPNDRTVEKTLRDIRPADLVSLTGYLVNAKADDGWSWHTSTSRGDSGAGACEVVFVDRVSVSHPPVR